MNYCGIKKHDIANGPGVRVSLFVSGCRNHCPGCFQPETWDFAYGEPFTKETEDEIITALRPSWIQGLSILGGDPMEPENQAALLPFIRRVKEELPDKDVWIYTGYLLEKISASPLLPYADVVVDGPFTGEEIYTRLMDGELANLVLTDPPYNVDVEETAGKIMNDNMGDQEFYNFLLSAYRCMHANLADDGSIYVWHADIRNKLRIDFTFRAFRVMYTIPPGSTGRWKSQGARLRKGQGHDEIRAESPGQESPGEPDWRTDRLTSPLYFYAEMRI